MTPHSHPLEPRRPVFRAARTPHRLVRRLARRLTQAVVAGAIVFAAGAPVVAHALPDFEVEPSVPMALRPVDEPLVDPNVVTLEAAYTWDEHSARVEELQRLLQVTPDGWYGPATRAAHLEALIWLDLATDEVPVPPGPDASAWAALRKCEAGGDYTITNPSGKYRGAYQFDRSTWNAVAGRNDPTLVGVDPAAASPADQDAMALALYHERGSRPWPHCGRHLR